MALAPFPALEGPVSSRMIGIDLGTAYTCAAYVDANDKPAIIPMDRGRRSIPSAVCLQGDKIFVGESAMSRLETDPSTVVHSWKRILGRPATSGAVRETAPRVGYRIDAGAGHEAAVFIGDAELPATWFAARVLYEVRLWAREHLSEVITSAVIAVPAHFTEPQRNAVREAALIAGFETLRLLTEPVAAAVAYGVTHDAEKRILVYDFGGGTFDVTVLDLAEAVFQVLSTGGDVRLGGVDFDERIMGHCVSAFRAQTGVDIGADVLAMARLRGASERVKRDLSERVASRVSLPFVCYGANRTPLNLDVPISREELEANTLDLVDRSIAACETVLAQANMSAFDMDEVLLVGGMARMPLIARRVEEHFCKPVRRGIHPDEAVALGAAVYARSLERADPLTIIDVTPMTICADTGNGELTSIIPAQARLPISRVHEVYSDRQGQTSFRLDFYQGARAHRDDCELIGTVHREGLLPVMADSLLAELVVSLDTEGRVRVVVRDTEGGEEELELSAAPEGLDWLKE